MEAFTYSYPVKVYFGKKAARSKRTVSMMS